MEAEVKEEKKTSGLGGGGAEAMTVLGNEKIGKGGKDRKNNRMYEE